MPLSQPRTDITERVPEHIHTLGDVGSLELGLPTNLPSSRVGIAENFPRMFAASSAAPNTATWTATAIYLPKGLVVTGITFFSGGTALATGTHQWFGLWDSSLTLARGSADDTSTAWAAQAAKRLALTTPYTVPISGRYYVGLEISATTVPTIAGISTLTGSAALRALTPSTAILDSTTADTAIAPTLAQAAAGLNILPYAVLD